VAELIVDTVQDRLGRRRFADLPAALHGGEPGWVPPLSADRSRVKARKEPWFEVGEAAYLLARRAGSPEVVGRCSAHLVRDDPLGRFGLLDAAGPEVVVALMGAAGDLLATEGCRRIRGPVSYADDEEAGAVVEGFHVPAVSGRPATPPWLPAAIEQAGLAPAAQVRWWRLPTDAGIAGPAPDLLPPILAESPGLARLLPAAVRSFADPRLLLGRAEVGHVVATPDLAGPRRALGGAKGAWALARRARQRDWEGAVILRIDGPPEVLVPEAVAAAGRAGYRWVVSPWAPDGWGPPEVVCQVYEGVIAGADAGPGVDSASPAPDGPGRDGAGGR
jgi:hypothetical protein